MIGCILKSGVGISQRELWENFTITTFKVLPNSTLKSSAVNISQPNFTIPKHALTGRERLFCPVCQPALCCSEQSVSKCQACSAVSWRVLAGFRLTGHRWARGRFREHCLFSLAGRDRQGAAVAISFEPQRYGHQASGPERNIADGNSFGSLSLPCAHAHGGLSDGELGTLRWRTRMNMDSES